MLLDNLQQKTKLSDIISIKEVLRKQLSALTAQLHLVDDIDTLNDIKTLFTSASNLIDSRQKLANFAAHKIEPVNKRIQRQSSFYSTKRKRQQAAVRIAKPTIEEKDAITTALLDINRSLYDPHCKPESISTEMISKFLPKSFTQSKFYYKQYLTLEMLLGCVTSQLWTRSQSRASQSHSPAFCLTSARKLLSKECALMLSKSISLLMHGWQINKKVTI